MKYFITGNTLSKVFFLLILLCSSNLVIAQVHAELTSYSEEVKLSGKLLKTSCAYEITILSKIGNIYSHVSIPFSPIRRVSNVKAWIVDKNGKTTLKELILTDAITENFPDFEISVIEMINELPILYPALKRGIPVATEYKLPINISVK